MHINDDNTKLFTVGEDKYLRVTDLKKREVVTRRLIFLT